VFTDHKQKNLIQDVLCLRTWPKIVYIKGIHNTIADTISRLKYDSSVNQKAESYFMTKDNKNAKWIQRQNWMAVSKYWCKLKLDTNKHEDLNLVFKMTEKRTKNTL
jgi:hypothetical protein